VRTLRAGGGYWIKERQAGMEVPMSRGTTYRCEILDHAEKDAALAGTRSATVITALDAVARGGEDAAPVSQHGRAVTGALDVQVPQVGMVTTYGSMTVKNPLVGGSAAPGRPPSEPLRPTPRPHVAPRGLPPAFDGKTAYRQYYGQFLEDPSERLATGKLDYTLRASTAELNRGTTRANRHIPGYAGHVAVHPRNQVTDEPRAYAKEDMCKGPSLDQYLRGAMPGYGGFKPQAPPNIRVDDPAQPRDVSRTLARTTQGAAALACTKLGPPKTSGRGAFISSQKGTMSFFTGGGLFVSENGKSNAQRFFMDVRPFEGTPSLHVPSKTTSSGYHFNR